MKRGVQINPYIVSKRKPTQHIVSNQISTYSSSQISVDAFVCTLMMHGLHWLHTCTNTYTGGQRWPVITITGGGRPHEKWVGLGYPQHSWWDGWPRPSPTLDNDNDNDKDKDSGGGIKNESGL